jgi:hypothetical protein
MSTRNHPGGKGWPVHKADNLTAIQDDYLENVKVLTTQHCGPPRALQGQIYLYFFSYFYLNMNILKYTELIFRLLFCMGMKLSFSHNRKKFENSELMKVSGPRMEEIIVTVKNCIMKSFLIRLPKYYINRIEG